MARRKLVGHNYHDVLVRIRRKEPRDHIIKVLGVGPNTIKLIRDTAKEQGWLDADAPEPDAATVEAAVAAFRRRGKPEATPQTSLAEEHRETIRRWVEKGMEAKTIHTALVNDFGFSGGYASVRRFVRRLKAAAPDPAVRLQFEAGDLAQVDFGAGPALLDTTTGKMRRTHIFVMTLAYSRHQYAEIVWDQSVATWLRCHWNAFEWFGGIPSMVRIDNLKAAITKACRNDPLVQRSYGEFAKQCGFIIDPCIVATPEHKGRVESGVRYVSRSFVNSPRILRLLPDSNAQLRQWVLAEAGNRIHGTTRKMPLQVFADEEKAALKPFPLDKPEFAVWTTAKLHPDCHVIFEKSYYSAPYKLIGKTLDLRATLTHVALFVDSGLVALHARATTPGAWRTQYDHYPPEKTAFLMQTPQWCLEQAEAVGLSCLEFMVELLGDQVVDRLRAAQGLIRLAKRYGRGRLEAACKRALAFDNIRYGAVKRILEKGLDQVPMSEGEGGQLSLPTFGETRFSRDIADLFAQN